MNQCVPSWELEDNNSPHPPRLLLRANNNNNNNSLPSDVPTLDYEVAELTWENGQLAMHGLGLPRLANKTTILNSPVPAPKYSSNWDKPTAVGTLESIVNQATTTVTQDKPGIDGGAAHDLLSWFNQENRRSGIPPTATTTTGAGSASAPANSVTLPGMDALVPCTNHQVLESLPGLGTSTRVGSCSCSGGAGTGTGVSLENNGKGREVRLARVQHEWSNRPDQSVTGSATCGFDSRQLTNLDTCGDLDLGTAGAGFTSTSLGSPENTSSAGKECTKSGDEHDSLVCRTSRNQREAGDEEANKKKGNAKLSVSTKRSRAAAIHNQSERKRRDKINQRMKTLQKLVPNSSKTDKASMLDEVIEYLKQLQAQVQVMNRMNMSSIMMPLAIQQQLHQMSMMAAAAPMAAGLGVNMGAAMGLGHHHAMDMNTMAAVAAAAAAATGGRANMAAIPSVFPPGAATFVTAPISWDCSAPGVGDHLSSNCTSAIPDPLSAAFLAFQSQPMTMETYSRMAALYQQFHHHHHQQQQQQPPQCPSTTTKTKVQ